MLLIYFPLKIKRGVLTQLQQEKGEIGLANLVSHLQTKISNPAENNQELNQIEPYQSLPSLILSPLPSRTHFSPPNMLYSPNHNIIPRTETSQVFSVLSFEYLLNRYIDLLS